MIRLMIFDHDMTIVDSSDAIMAGFNFVADAVGRPRVTHGQVMKYIATPIAEFCKGLLGEFHLEWIEMYRENNAAFERDLIRPFPETVPTMARLHEMGILLAVASNREDPRPAMERTGLVSCFDAIAGAAQPFGRLPYKPDPAMLLKLTEYFNVPPEEAVYVGDADIDIQTAIAAKMRGIGVTYGNFSAARHLELGAWRAINSLSELVGIAAAEI